MNIPNVVQGVEKGSGQDDFLDRFKPDHHDRVVDTVDFPAFSPIINGIGHSQNLSRQRLVQDPGKLDCAYLGRFSHGQDSHNHLGQGGKVLNLLDDLIDDCPFSLRGMGFLAKNHFHWI
jgi:hypothetical protein